MQKNKNKFWRKKFGHFFKQGVPKAGGGNFPLGRHKDALLVLYTSCRSWNGGKSHIAREWRAEERLVRLEVNLVQLQWEPKSSMSKGRSIEPETTIAALRTRNQALGCTKRYKFAKDVLYHCGLTITLPRWPPPPKPDWLARGGEGGERVSQISPK